MAVEFRPEDSGYSGLRTLPDQTELLGIRIFTVGIPRNVPVDKFGPSLDRIRGWAIKVNGLVVPIGLWILHPTPKSIFDPTIISWTIYNGLFESMGLSIGVSYKDKEYFGRIFPIPTKE